MFCQLTLQTFFSVRATTRKTFHLGNPTAVERIGLLFLCPLCSLPKHAAMPKPLCNLEGIFILPQGQHVFSLAAPLPKQFNLQNNPTRPGRTGWADRRLRWLLKHRGVYRAELSKLTTENRSINFDKVIITITKLISTDMKENPHTTEKTQM